MARVCILAAIFVLICLGSTAPAWAAPNCEGTVLAPIPNDSYDKPGDVISYLHLESINDDGSPATYAVEGGGIYPAQDIKLLNCHIDKKPTPDGTGFDYSLVLDDTPANAKEMIRSSVEDQLISDGMDDADAGNGASAYVEQPDSGCGQAVKMILQGNTEMVQIVESGGICQPH